MAEYADLPKTRDMTLDDLDGAAGSLEGQSAF